MAALNEVHESNEQSSYCWHVAESGAEQRRQPRLGIGVCASFRNAGGHRCTAYVENLSSSGVQIRCNTANAQILHPFGGKVCPSNAPIVQAELSLPFGDRARTVSLCAQLVYVTCSDDEPRCIIGLRFLEPRPTAQRILDQFFEKQTVFG